MLVMTISETIMIKGCYMTTASIPDITTITNRMTSDVNHYIPGAELRPRFSVLGILVKVFGAAIHALYQFSQNLMANNLPSTCSTEWLPAWAYVLRTPQKTDESLDDWRLRLVAAFANRAKVGDADDYTEWAIAAHVAIKYAWVYANTPALGDITIVVATGDDDPIPSSEVMTAALEKLNTLRNVGCRVLLMPPEALPVAVTLAHVPMDMQASVEYALLNHIKTLRRGGQTLYVADLHAAIRTVYSGIYSLTSPVTDVAAGEYQLITLGKVTWQ